MNLNKIYLYRITHINNIAHILKYGITHSNSLNANNDYMQIGDGSLISTRNGFKLNNGRKLGEYIPFYFGKRMPMLYVIQKGFNQVNTYNPEDIVYCVSSVEKIIDSKLEFIFTDGHANNSLSMQYEKNDIENLNNILDFKAIKDNYWNKDDDLDFKRRKESEFLILGDIPFNAVLGFIVYNQSTKDKINKINDIDIKINVNQDDYF